MKELPPYCFEGTAKVTCNKCGITQTFIFSGGDGDSIQGAIEDALLSENWHPNHMVCPDCYENLDEDELNNEEDISEEDSIMELDFDDDY